MRYRGVIFDLWDTLVEWPVEPARAHRQRLVDHLGLDEDAFQSRWLETFRARETGPLAAAYAALGIADADLDVHVRDRHDVTRAALRPRDGAIETLEELRRRGHKLGLISMCTEDVPAIWPETELANRLDAEIFSATCGLVKPEPEIYRRAADELDVAPEECLYVGDGANDELRGARDVGMTPVLIVPRGRDPYWPELRDWDGLRIHTIPEVLELC